MLLQRAFTKGSRLGLFALLPAVLTAQTSDRPAAAAPAASNQSLRFEIADIHPSPYSFQSNYFRSNIQGTDRYLFHQASLLDLVAFAYKLEPTHVFGGPTWLDFDHYDIAAKQPQSTSLNTTRLMLRNLLADRFKLVVHNDTRFLPAQIITVGKGAPKMKPAADTTVPSQCQSQQPHAGPLAHRSRCLRRVAHPGRACSISSR